jgi:hypothetical protein
MHSATIHVLHWVDGQAKEPAGDPEEFMTSLKTTDPELIKVWFASF